MSFNKKHNVYGLIKPQKGASNPPQGATPKVVKKASVFNEESSDEETGTDWRKRAMEQTNLSRVKKQTQLEMSRALQEDPTVYQYDEVFESMEAEKAQKSADAAQKKKEQDRKPRYISSLLKHAEIRNREKERRLERQVQKERETEGDEFADKESFVTSAYRKKMEEMQKLEEEERKQDMVEDMLNVTKQKDMSGFYRHLYRQTMGEEKGQKEETVKQEPETEETPTSSIDMEKTNIKEEPKEEEIEPKKIVKAKARSYRKVQDTKTDESEGDSSSSDNSSESDADEEEIKTKAETEKEKLEAEKKRREALRVQKEKRERRKRKIEEGATSSEDEEDEQQIDEKDKDKIKAADDGKTKQPREKKVKLEVWIKVTVGDLFDAALKRYFERKAARTKWP